MVQWELPWPGLFALNQPSIALGLAIAAFRVCVALALMLSSSSTRALHWKTAAIKLPVCVLRGQLSAFVLATGFCLAPVAALWLLHHMQVWHSGQAHWPLVQPACQRLFWVKYERC